MITVYNTKAFHATSYSFLRCASLGKLPLPAGASCYSNRSAETFGELSAAELKPRLSRAAHVEANTPIWLPTEIPASGLLYLPLEPAGTPEANPVLVVELDITDAVTQQPMAANVYLIHAAAYREPTHLELMMHNTERVEIKLPATLDSWFVIRAPGYADWPLRLHYRIKTSRKLTGPIQLKRLPGQGTTI